MSSVDELADLTEMFVWISHGSSVTIHYNYYPIKSGFKTVILYSEPHRTISLGEVKNIMHSSCQIAFGRNRFPTTNGVSYLPPLLFSISERDNADLKEAIGLYYLQIQGLNTGSGNCAFKQVVKMLDWAAIHKEFQYDFFTYSSIFKLVKKLPTKSSIRTVPLGIFCCQSPISYYAAKYELPANDLPVIRNPPAKTYIQSNSDETPHVTYAMISIQHIENLANEWTALGTISYQGCALNVLSFYGLLSEESAREKVTCLTIKGTSIFQIADYLNEYYQALGRVTNGFLVCRYSLTVGMYNVYEFANSMPADSNCAIIVKLYKTQYQSLATFPPKDSHIGHTVSFLKLSNKQLMLIDPQMNLFADISNMSYVELAEYVKFMYNLSVENGCADILFKTAANESEFKTIYGFGPPAVNTATFVNRHSTFTYPGRIVVKPADIDFGGSARSRSARSLSRSRSARSLSKASVTQRLSSSQNALDDFEKIMFKVDRQNGISRKDSALQEIPPIKQIQKLNVDANALGNSSNNQSSKMSLSPSPRKKMVGPKRIFTLKEFASVVSKRAATI